MCSLRINAASPRNKVADRRLRKETATVCTFPPRAGALLFGREFLVIVPCNVDPHAAHQPHMVCSLLHATSQRSYSIFNFFFSFVSKMLFSFTGCHRSKCTSRFYSSRLYNEAENELAGCTDTSTKNKISMTLELEFYYFYYFHVRKVCVSASVMWRVMGAVCVVVTHRVEFECKIWHNF